jgi:GNAT superfamily N-acetyltransferase
MSEIHVREASLDDTGAISRLFRAHIGVWQRLNAQGQVEDVPYEALTIYERWLHGGPWMSVETGAMHLSHLLLGAGVPLVALVDGQVLAYAEAYLGAEPEPFGEHLHLATLSVHPDYTGAGLDDALVAHLLEQARALKCQRLTAVCISADTAMTDFYVRHGLGPLARIVRYSLPARTGQVFYKAVEHPNPDPTQIHGWYMPIGRLGSARQQWETLWPRFWDVIPEIRARRTQRLHVVAAGQPAFLCCQQQLYAPRNADVYCWTPKPLTSQVLTAIRDWAHREGYRTLALAVVEDTVKTLGPEAEPDVYTHEVYAVEV